MKKPVNGKCLSKNRCTDSEFVVNSETLSNPSSPKNSHSLSFPKMEIDLNGG